ncbi:M20 metallopeptidase family protein [Paramaledivibacter caminithermalis]|jgi:amidohydrolase|uniref:Amidohydrolase n=1 Tax=Paramaledivibacter caminithermalis (strain DSM 15212 / CIP 107654 / DViRD3) TaxID=1121301 RepID=A0A1M6PVE4_PARC5|nr:M20 family metallopeptidase [Paramaledivibacter caminithermalis]SHK11963.1 amidohydrolase [Paramaledivibacter caminithermalis DSM 15212]
MSNVLSLAEGIKEWLIEVRRDFHMYPEFGMEEHRTSEMIAKYLDEMEIEYKKGIANTGVVGIIRGKDKGKTVALRADMDALPIEEKNQVSYKSKIEGKMHACGHDAHMAIVLGAAKLLNNMKDNLKGNIKLFFQPAEETVGGAKPMIEEGVMDNPKVDAVFGLHVAPEIPAGKIGIKYGKMNASSDSIKIIINGESTHGAYPHSGVDAIVIAGHVITALQTIVSRNIDPRNSVVVTLGVINGGTRGNIIADKVEMIGTVRTLDPQTRKKVLSRIKETVQKVSESLGGSGEIIVEEGYVSLINNDDMVDIVRTNALELLGRDNIKVLQEASLGVEDFAYFLQKSPGAFFRLGCGNVEKGIVHDGHHCLFDVDEDCLSIGVAIQVQNVLSILNK